MVALAHREEEGVLLELHSCDRRSPCYVAYTKYCSTLLVIYLRENVSLARTALIRSTNQPHFQESPSPATAHGRTTREPSGGGAYNAVKKATKTRLDGLVTVDTVCSALRVRGLQQRRRTSAPDAAGGGAGEAVGSGSRGKLKGRRGRRSGTGVPRRRRPRGAATGKTGVAAAESRDETIAR